MIQRMLALAVLVVVTGLGVVGSIGGAESPAAAAGVVHAVDNEPHPSIPADASWVRYLVIVIGAMFAAAIPIGIGMWSRRVEEPVVADEEEHSHSHEAHEHDRQGLDKLAGKDPHGGSRQ